MEGRKVEFFIEKSIPKFIEIKCLSYFAYPRSRWVDNLYSGY